MKAREHAAQEETDMQRHLSIYLNMIIVLYLIGLESHVTGHFHWNEKVNMGKRVDKYDYIIDIKSL